MNVTDVEQDFLQWLSIKQADINRLATHFLGCGCMMSREGPCEVCALQARRVIDAYVSAWGGRYEEAIEAIFDEYKYPEREKKQH